jgi:tRNA nucleotidyltransferase (CCA-adding enzyme)
VKVFRVGGSVRDELLGMPVKDHDYVVVGSTPEEMIERGFRPVGKDFPVFLHPETHEEYALARTERKTGPGYKGFSIHAAPDVTLEEDLARRDLTINAIARDEQGTLIDPFNGVADLQARTLRHVGPAFIEDPVRILRVARFAARFQFSVAPETRDLMQRMVANGEADHLVSERVWQELSRGLMEPYPSLMIKVLRDCSALARILPEVDALFGVPQPPTHHPEIDTGVHVMLVLDYAARERFPLPVRYAALTHDLGKATTPKSDWPRHVGHELRSLDLLRALSERLRVPADCKDVAELVARHHVTIHRAEEMKPTSIVRLLEKTDAFRRPDRFRMILDACLCDYRGRAGLENRSYPAYDLLLGALEAARSVNAGDIAREHVEPARIAAALHQARVQAVKQRLSYNTH